MTDWPSYRSHKIIQAMEITGTTPDGVLLVGPDKEPFFPTEAGMTKRVTAGDYALRYPDGFQSVSPKQAFEDGYTRIDE
jgi:hypothetical protein